MAGKRVRPPLTHFLAIPLFNQSSAPALSSSIASFARLTRSEHTTSEISALTQETDGSDDTFKAVHARLKDKRDLESDGMYISRDKLRALSHPVVQLPLGSVRPPSTLHLTLGVMSLSEPELVEAAGSMLRNMDISSMLQKCMARPSPTLQEAAVLENQDRSRSCLGRMESSTPPIKIRLTGLTPMQEPNATTVLYASPEDDDGRLLRLCEALRAEFIAQRLLVPEKRELKLHATIVNTIYAKKQNQSRRGRKEPLKIDARELIAQWAECTWAEVTLEKVVLCEMGAKEDETGELRYNEVAEAPLI